MEHTTHNTAIWSTLIKYHQDISELTTYSYFIFKKKERKPIQKWHYNHEDKYLKWNNVKENKPVKLWVIM